MVRRVFRVCAAVTAAVLLFGGPARADMTLTGGPSVLLNDTRRFVKFDAAYDSIHQIYLAVYGTQAFGPVNGLLLDHSGQAITGLFAVSDGPPQSGWARVIFSPEQGKFLVSYVKIVGASHHQRIVRYMTIGGTAPNVYLSSIGPEIILDDWIGDSGTATGMAYSAPAGKFLVTWSHYSGAFPVSYAVAVDPSGAVGTTYVITNTADGQSDPEIACDPVNRKCLVVGIAWGTQAGGKSSFWARFIDDATGAPLDTSSFYVAVWGGLMDPPAIVFDTSTHNFLIGLGMGGLIKGLTATATGNPGLVNPPFVMLQDTTGTNGGGYGFISMRFNPAKQTTVMSMTTWIGWAAVQELDGAGGKISNGFFLVPDTPEGAPSWGTQNQYTVPVANTITSQTLLLENHYFYRMRSNVFGLPFCASLSGTGTSFNPAGGSEMLTVTANSTCSWTSTSNAGWIHVTAGATGAGSSTMTYSVDANPTIFTRSGTLTIGGRTYTVTQSGLPCTSGVSPTSVAISAPPTNGTLNVTLSVSQCPWNATTTSPYLSFTNGTGRTGTGTLPFAVAGNFSTTSSRTSTAIIAGQMFTVTQDPAVVDAVAVARERARADFNGDGYSDLIWQDSSSGMRAVWYLQGGAASRTPAYLNPGAVDLDWQIVGTGDFNGDGKPDIVWWNRNSGTLYLWYMDGVTRIGDGYFSMRGISDTRWKVAGVADFNGDGHPDILWQHDTLGWVGVWEFNDRSFIAGFDLTPGQVDVPWKIVGVADFNADGQPDLLWRNVNNGMLAVWYMNGTTRQSVVSLTPGLVDDLDWQVAAVIDINRDQTPDIVWRNNSKGWVAVWYMNGTVRVDVQTFPFMVDTTWKIVGPK